MANSKRMYSKLAEYYNGFVVPGSEKDRVRYEKSKERERKYNEHWKQHKVSLNELVNKYAPGETPKIKGVKAIFDGDKYKVIADLPSGYVKVQEKATKKWLNYDGTFKRKDENDHFKILRLEEMK